MTTVYIKKTKVTGPKNDAAYKAKIRKALRKSDLDEGDHYIEEANPEHETALYWKTSRITIRDLKKAIGADLIFEYRLKFYEDVQDLLPVVDTSSFTEKELELISVIRSHK